MLNVGVDSNTPTQQYWSVSNPPTAVVLAPIVYFTKSPECIIGTNKGVESHSNITKWLDYEAELAVIIGKKGKDIEIENALKYVFGYTVANDITARDIQKKQYGL